MPQSKKARNQKGGGHGPEAAEIVFTGKGTWTSAMAALLVDDERWIGGTAQFQGSAPAAEWLIECMLERSDVVEAVKIEDGIW